MSTIRLVAIALGIPENKMRWIVPTDIGGGFGTKTGMYPYVALITLAAKKIGGTVKWIEDRREHLLASATGTDRVTYMEAAVKKDGTILGLKDKAIDNTGGYIRPPEPGCAYRSTGNHTGAYQIRNLDREVLVVGTNKCLTAPNRGYGCQELYFSVERIVDMAAAKVGMDPARDPVQKLHPAKPVSVHDGHRRDLRRRGLSEGLSEGPGHDRLQKDAGRSRKRPGRREG